MKKKFNITGICYPHRHYMMDSTQKMKEVMQMVDDGDYFIINRPRQYGKTTTLFLLGEALNDLADYVPIEMNFQGIDEQWHQSDQQFAQMFYKELVNILDYQQPSIRPFLKEQNAEVEDMGNLSNFITQLVDKLDKKLVLIIDEVDASSTYAPFIRLLGMLRTKYLRKHKVQHATFHSVVLAGVHDIKTLKHKIREPQDSKYLSPWNIAADFKIRMSFIPSEIVPMLKDYSEAESVSMDISAMADKLYYYTAGYPFLVSKLCKIIAEEVLPKKESAEQNWSLEDLETAVQLLLKEHNTNFDTLIKNLENNKDLYDLAYRIIIEGEIIPSNPDEPIIYLGQLYGFFKSNGSLKIHNRIYEQRIYNYMTAKTIVNFPKVRNYAGHFLLDNHELDLEAVLLKFQQVMKEQHSLKTTDFLEEQGRLVFLSFLAPILNGHGYSFKEV
ncbi:MAG: AAA-like domain-containing protein, partial [Saprospiraceae bacterium]